MENDLFNITIRIAEREFKPKIRRGDEALYREAAKYVDSKFLKYAKKHSKQDLATYLSLASLELAIELLNERKEKSSIYDRIETLGKELDEYQK